VGAGVERGFYKPTDCAVVVTIAAIAVVVVAATRT